MRLSWQIPAILCCALASGATSCGGSRGQTSSCANVGCGLVPICEQGCQAECGCCSCRPGQREGDLLCTDMGCYVRAPLADAATVDRGDASVSADDADAHSDAREAGSTADAALDAGQEAAPRTDGGADASWAAPPACALAFDPGPCKAAITVFAFVDGACAQRTYGGCEGNANRFASLEECMATCEGRPKPFGCSAGRKPAELCVTCGPAGGCAMAIQVCAQVCDQATPCASSQMTCTGGLCQAASSCI